MNRIAGASTARVEDPAAGVAPGDAPRASFTLLLPLPPSVNEFERDRFGRPLGNRSSKVKAWRREADIHFWMAKPRPVGVRGDFAVAIAWDRYAKRRGLKSRFDIDNRLKPLLDWLQSRELIRNDGFCDDLHVFWDAPSGYCRVTVRELPT